MQCRLDAHVNYSYDPMMAQVLMTDEATAQSRRLPKPIIARVLRIIDRLEKWPDAKGLRPARETLRAILARDIIKDRLALGWSQRELARRSGIRPETLSRIESGLHTPTVATIERIDRAFSAAGGSRSGRNSSN